MQFSWSSSKLPVPRHLSTLSSSYSFPTLDMFVAAAALVGLFLCVSTVGVLLFRRIVKARAFRNIAGPSNGSFIAGHLMKLYGLDATPWHQYLSDTYGRVIKLRGLMGDTQLLVADPKALNHILVKDQYVFEETDFFLESNRLALGPGLSATIGDAHRKQRKLLNPVFSAAHMKLLVPVFHHITLQLQDVLRQKVADGPQTIDMLDWMGRLALEAIAQAGLGHTFNTMDGDPHTYAWALKQFFPTLGRISKWSALAPPANVIRKFPPYLLRLAGRLMPWDALHRLMNVVEILDDESQDLWNDKKALLAKGDDALVSKVNEGKGKDLLSVLLSANKYASQDDQIPDAELRAQMSMLILAGTDTTSSALGRILCLLAEHPEVQDKLRKELAAVDGQKGKLSYDDLNALPYLEAVCRETLRLHAPATFVQRVSRKDMVVPLDKPIKGINGEEIHQLFIPNDTEIVVHITGVNRDRDIWGADALEWKPERWLAPLPASVTDARIPGVYSNMMTFLGGGRSCIGFKFSQLEMKVVLSQLVHTFRFSLPKEEIVWNFSSIIFPVVKDSGIDGPHLPLLVALA
ncbi:cytochrome P450 [Amylostereum chailletii]|nr:cytochrome P450 [Amylostereum chailletii]